MNPILNDEATNSVDMPRLIGALERRAPLDAAELLAHWPDETILEAIEGLDANFALQLIEQFPDELRTRLLFARTARNGKPQYRQHRPDE